MAFRLATCVLLVSLATTAFTQNRHGQDWDISGEIEWEAPGPGFSSSDAHAVKDFGTKSSRGKKKPEHAYKSPTSVHEENLATQITDELEKLFGSLHERLREMNRKIHCERKSGHHLGAAQSVDSVHHEHPSPDEHGGGRRQWRSEDYNQGSGGGGNGGSGSGSGGSGSGSGGSSYRRGWF